MSFRGRSSAGSFKEWLDNLRRPLQSHRHTALLAALVIAFAVRPLIGDSPAAPLLFSLAFVALLVVALYTTQVDELLGDRDVLLVQRKRRNIVGWVLAAPAIAERLFVIFGPNRRLSIVGALCWLLFLSFVTWSQLRILLKHREVTGETIAMSISVYLLLGLTWGMLYIGIFEIHPGAFKFAIPGGLNPALWHDEQHVFPIFIYFSLTTLSTIGFGDITPLTLQARYAAVAEGITGQFYLAILVARLVGMHMSRSVHPAPGDDG